MAPSVRLDTIEGNPQAIRDKIGWALVDRMAIVEDTEGIGDEKIISALDHEDIPGIGTAHPAISGLYVTKHTAEAIDNKNVRVRITYERRSGGTSELDNPAYATIDVGTALVSGLTDHDKDNQELYTRFKEKGSDTWSKKQTKWVDIELPVSTIVYRRSESTSPASKSRTYTGKVNSGPWSLDLNCAARTWKCDYIRGTSSDGGLTYDVEYHFSYSEEKWNTIIHHTKDGEAVHLSDATAEVKAEARKEVELLHEANFNNLNL